MKSIMAVSVLAVFTLAAPLAHADDVIFVNINTSPGVSNGYCAVLDAGVKLSADRTALEISGDVLRSNKRNDHCPDMEADNPWADPTQPVQYAISYVLYKWDGSQAVLCGSSPGWPGWEQPAPTMGWAELTSPNYSGSTLGVRVSGCGPGYYIVGTQGYFLDSSGWKGGVAYTNWDFLDVNAPVIK